MSVLQIVEIGAGVILMCMVILWIVSLRIKDASVVDIFWGLGFIVLNGVYFAFTDGFITRKTLLAVLVMVWGLRLATYIGSRHQGKGEDKRYQAFRVAGGKNYWWISFFQVFVLQAVLLLLISAPLLAAQISSLPHRLTILDYAGTGLWVIGFLFEAVADVQLARFKSKPSNTGKVMQGGLWRYTRHPNYFGEAVLWWGYFLIALSVPGGYLTVFSPLLMTFLLLRVSGVALLEKSLSASKPEYQEYIETTSAFIPWFPRGKG